MNKNDPAFPLRAGVTISGERGLTKLEWFAGMAEIPWDVAKAEVMRVTGKRDGNVFPKEIIEMRACLRFVEAEAMLAEPEKRK